MLHAACGSTARRSAACAHRRRCAFFWTGNLHFSKTAMTKSELIEALAQRQKHLAANDVELAVKSVLEQMSHSLSTGERIEIRGFGSFSLHYRPPRMGRNPKTGDSVALPGKHVPHFKPGKELRERVNGNGDASSDAS
jgi:integration host factor subunit beta